jgi:hypothetical protein
MSQSKAVAVRMTDAVRGAGVSVPAVLSNPRLRMRVLRARHSLVAAGDREATARENSRRQPAGVRY